MQKWLIASISIMLCVPFRMSAQDSYADKVNRYVQQYSKLAVSEQERSGVPAAVTLGQGILETQAGCSELVTGANNHFGIKCKSGWTGETFSHTDDAPNECFRKYKCCEDSYKDHSNYLKNTPRYASLFRLSPTDYAGWAYGLKRCGYATNPRYAQQLIKIIEDFHLQAYTYAAMGKGDMPGTNDVQTEEKAGSVRADNANTTLASTPAATVTTVSPVESKKKTSREIVNVYEGAPAKGRLLKVNGLRAFYALKGEMLLQYALKFNVRYEHLLEINDLKDAPLPASMFVYLEKKNYKGVRPTHVVKPGENLLMISQAEGIQLRRLMTLNKLTIYGEEPVPGTVLNLQEPAERKPQVAFVYPPKEPLPIPRHKDIYAQNTTPATTATAAATAPGAVTSTPVAVETSAVETPAKTDDYISKPATEEIVTTTTQEESPVQATPEVKEEVAAAPAETTTQTSTNVNGEAPAAVVQNETTPVQTAPDAKEENTAATPAETTPAAPVANTEVTAPAATVATEPVTNAEVATPAPETPKPTELGEKPLLKDDGQETAATATAEKVQPKPEATKEVQPVEVQAPAATAEPVTTVNTAPATTQLTEETKPDVATAPVAKEIATETVAAEQIVTKPTETVVDYAKPVVTEIARPEETPASAPAEASKPSETIAASEPAKTPQPVHIDAQDNPAAAKPVDATAVASVSTPAATVEEEEEAKPAAASTQPQDDFARLKARLDKVVYAKNDNSAAANAGTAAPVANATPVVASKEVAAAETVKVNADDANKYYTVRKGDTAFNIAKRHNITMRQLLNWNNLDFETVKIGQRLRVKE